MVVKNHPTHLVGTPLTSPHPTYNTTQHNTKYYPHLPNPYQTGGYKFVGRGLAGPEKNVCVVLCVCMLCMCVCARLSPYMCACYLCVCPPPPLSLSLAVRACV